MKDEEINEELKEVLAECQKEKTDNEIKIKKQTSDENIIIICLLIWLIIDLIISIVNDFLIEFFISFGITALAYCLIPFLVSCAKIKIHYHKIQTIIIINNAIVWLLFRIIANGTISGAVFFYYFVNKKILSNSIYKCEYCNKILTSENESEHKGVCKECNTTL